MENGRDLKKTIALLSRDSDPSAVQDFVSGMDRDYFTVFTPREIRTHLKMSLDLNADHPVRLKITPRGKDRFNIAIVAFDYFSEFSILCGLLASFELEIQKGHSHTFLDRRPGPQPPSFPRGRWPRRFGRPIPGRKKIVDVFDVRARPGQAFTVAKRLEFENELDRLIRLLGEGQSEAVREHLNRRLVERMEKRKSPFAGLLYPVEVRFDNRSDPQWTVMDVHSKDTPAFLYALSNALALRDVYIHKVRIQSVQAEARDRFYISNRQGRKIEGEREQKALRIALVLIKQFTHFLPWAPDPAKAIRFFDQLLDKVMEKKTAAPFIELFKEKQGLDLLAHLLGASDFLWEDFLRMQFENLMPVLEGIKKRPRRPGKPALSRDLAARLARGATPDEKKRILNEFKDREMFSIDMSHLIDPMATLTDFSSALTDLAEAVVDHAARIGREVLRSKHGRPRLESGAVCPFAVCGLGKFGGREMGYASDIELLFVYGGPGRTDGPESVENSLYFERLCQEILRLIEARQEGIFHIDLRLRPDGTKGPLAVSLDRFRSYYQAAGEAAPFERQALTKLRFVAGDPSLGRAIEDHRDRFVFGVEPWDRDSALHLRQRQVQERVRPGGVNVKYSPGGIIDIEYAAQYLQIQHGHRHPELRTPNTLEALDRLGRLRLLSKKDVGLLRDAYLFLRNLIDGLRMVRGNAEDLILPEESSDEFKFLARRLGYHEADWKKGARRLADDVHRHMKNVHAFFSRRFSFPPTEWPPGRTKPS
jgi:glutamate-ammonia-ligase adenylyltransferase